jgi:hypothetical protein
MKKYVLNIEKLFTGETANALVLNQVDEDLPTLLPPLEDYDSDETASDWIERMNQIVDGYSPFEQTYTVSYTIIETRNKDTENEYSINRRKIIKGQFL